jgi:uncharacterized protein (TIGR00255 family)
LALSMTGYGTAEGDLAGRRAQVEIRTVNHRYFHCTVRLPADLSALEAEFRERLKQSIDRGHVTATVNWTDAAASAATRIDWEKAAAAAEALRELKTRFGLGGEITVEQVARFPEVIGSGRSATSAEWAALAPLADTAIAECLSARRREGEALSDELDRRVDAIAGGMSRVAALLPGRLEREMSRLRVSVRELLGGVDVHPERLVQELALLADRVDVTEEMVRLGAHLAAVRQALAGDKPVGKQLGFLAQEIGREVNTIGSKANDAFIAHEVVAMKGELEKMREQLENLE